MTKQTARDAARNGLKKRKPMYVLSPWTGKWRRVLSAQESKADTRRVIITPEEGTEFGVTWNTKLESR